jgi:uncharacterized repeat protein (TIGR01451 family)
MKIKLAIAFLSVVLLGGVALGQSFILNGNPDDTKVGTPITSEGYNNFLMYQNISTTLETVYTPTSEFPVAREAGFWSAIYPENLAAYAVPGVSATFEVIITNEGNSDMTIIATKSSFTYEGGASNWTTHFIEGGVTKESIHTLLSEDAEISFEVVISPSSIETESPNASAGTITFTMTNEEGYPLYGWTAGDPLELYYFYQGASPYLGGGGRYGGMPTAESLLRVDIQAPVMSLTREMTIDAPTLYTGDPHDAVPGSVITYSIWWSNDGASDATNVIVVDKVPEDTEGYHVNKAGAQPNVTITADSDTGISPSGFRVYYSKAGAPSFVYGDYTDWTLLGTLETGAPILAGVTLTTEATFVKWERHTVPAGDNNLLSWGVTIK